ncbi:MAG: hypothetical protein OEY09_04215 [Gammaproteobacteria bacterium]|nr:hypothetical protein [Gammaproteobacteria bacterium]
MSEARFNLIFNGEIESGRDLDDARSTLESLFEFNTEEKLDYFDGKTLNLGTNMDAGTAKSFQQALACSGIITHILETDGIIEEEDTQTQRGEQRRQNTERRARIRSGAILPDRRQAPERRG